MTGGILIVSRNVNLHSFYKQKLEARGFTNVSMTAADKDGLIMIINELKPRLIMIDSCFNQCATHYMIKCLINCYKKIKFVVVSFSDYPAELAMWLVINGVNSYISFLDGVEQFNFGLDCVRDGKVYISDAVREKIDNREFFPPVASDISERGMEVMRLIFNGFYGYEIADVLHISRRTVEHHRKELYNNLGIRNEIELVRIAGYLRLVNSDELIFYGGKYEISPKPQRKLKIKN